VTLKYTAEKEGCANAETREESVEHGETEIEVQSSRIQLDLVEDKEEQDDAGDSRYKMANLTESIGNQMRSGHCFRTQIELGMVSWTLM
jgi:hypothetical protein